MVHRCVRARNLMNEEALAQWGLLRKKQADKQTNFRLFFTIFNLFVATRLVAVPRGTAVLTSRYVYLTR